MGISESKPHHIDNYNLYEDNKITVNFIQIRKAKNCDITLEQLNILLGLNTPKYSILKNTNYPYLFCVGNLVDINKIIEEYGYEVGYSTKQKVFTNEYNSYHKAICSYDVKEYYKLVHV